EGEGDVARGDGRTILPARPGVQMEGQGQRVGPSPAVGELGLEVLVADRVSVCADVGQLEEYLVVDVAVEGFVGDGREQRGRLADGGEDDGAAVVARAATPLRAGTCREDDQEKQQGRS